jgi:hypothetical protein
MKTGATTSVGEIGAPVGEPTNRSAVPMMS